jgi:hypothetical protein
MSSSYEKFYICLLGRYVSLLLGGGWPAEAASDARRRNPQWITLSLRAPKIRQNVASGRPRPAGAALAGVPAPQERTSGRPRPAGVNFPRFTLLLGGWRRKSNTGEAYRYIPPGMLNFTYEDDIKIKNKHVEGISRTYYLPIQTISRPPPISWEYPFNLLKIRGPILPTGCQALNLGEIFCAWCLTQNIKDKSNMPDGSAAVVPYYP